MLAHHCLYPDWGGITDKWTKRKRDIDNPGHGLALITSQYTDQSFYKDEGRHWRPEAGELAFWRYNCLDVMVTYEAAFKMMDELRSLNLWEVYEREYLQGFETLLRMEWFGTPIDVEKRAAARVELLLEMNTIREELEDSWKLRIITKSEKKGQKPQPHILNLASPAQVKTFFEKRGYKIPINRKTMKPKLDKDDLAALAIKHDDDSIRRMLRIREIQDLINDVIDQQLDENNRIHTHYRLGGTNVTRLSSGESILGGGTNLQNLPRQGVARSLFIP
jgi:DNA polymerase I-like protein with 3'-5' exonuclease and polymerase domains